MDKTFKKKVKFIYHVADFFGPSNLMLDHSFGHIVETSRERVSYQEASSPARALPHECFAYVCFERIYYSRVKQHLLSSLLKHCNLKKNYTKRWQVTHCLRIYLSCFSNRWILISSLTSSPILNPIMQISHF
jgi:hypothetical protein